MQPPIFPRWSFRLPRALVLLPALVVLVAAGCSGGGTTSDKMDALAVGMPDGGSMSGSDRVAYPRLTLAFRPSNMPADLTVPDGPAIELLGSCVADGAAGTLTCAGTAPEGFEHRLVDQGDAAHTQLAVFAAKSVTIAVGASLRVAGPHPIALVVADKLLVAGEIAGVPEATDPGKGQGGGASTPSAAGAGTGAGAGGPPDVAAGAGPGGGGYCGAGGDGGSGLLGGSMNGGAIVGTPALVPLLGGSSGGRGSATAGAGGGAIALVAGASVEIAASGGVHAGGGGGKAASGGGSGGAILIEAPVVRVAGIVSVNGGGGGANNAEAQSAGQSAVANPLPALGGTGTFPCTSPAGSSGHNDGGRGAADGQAAGDRGTYDCAPGGGLPNVGGGGGGGAGRIRINSTSGAADSGAATFSPNATSGCITEGSIPG